MMHYVSELAVWMLGAYFAGCVIGAVLRNVLAPPSGERTH